MVQFIVWSLLALEVKSGHQQNFNTEHAFHSNGWKEENKEKGGP